MMNNINNIGLARLLLRALLQDQSGDIMNRSIGGVALVAAALSFSALPAKADFAVLIQQADIGPYAFVEDCGVTVSDGVEQSYDSNNVTQLPDGNWLCTYELDDIYTTALVTRIEPVINCFEIIPYAEASGSPLAVYVQGEPPAAYPLDLSYLEPCDSVPQHYGYVATIPQSVLPENSELQFVSLSGASANYWMNCDLVGDAWVCTVQFDCDPVNPCEELPDLYVLTVTVSCGGSFLEDEVGVDLQYDGYEGVYYTADVAYDVAELFDDVEGCPTADADLQDMAFSLEQNWPNPFNPVTSISFQLPETASVRLGVYNLAGQRVALLAEGMMEAGMHQVSFDGSNLSSGIYVYALQTGNSTLTRRMTLIK